MSPPDTAQLPALTNDSSDPDLVGLSSPQILILKRLADSFVAKCQRKETFAKYSSFQPSCRRNNVSKTPF